MNRQEWNFKRKFERSVRLKTDFIVLDFRFRFLSFRFYIFNDERDFGEMENSFDTVPNKNVESLINRDSKA